MWSSICPCGFGILEATIACQELCGARAYGSVLRGRTTFGEDVADLSIYPYRVLMMNCSSQSERLADCNKILGLNETQQSSCTSNQGVGIRCYELDSSVNKEISAISKCIKINFDFLYYFDTIEK